MDDDYSLGIYLAGLSAYYSLRIDQVKDYYSLWTGVDYQNSLNIDQVSMIITHWRMIRFE